MSKQFEAVTIPKWGIEMTHGRIVEWRCAEGASVQAGDELVDIETDKIVNSFEARESGTLARILVAEGDELAVGTLIGVDCLGRALHCRSRCIYSRSIIGSPAAAAERFSGIRRLYTRC